MVERTPGVLIAADQRPQHSLNPGEDAGLRVYNPDAFEALPTTVERVLMPENLAAGRAALSLRKDERVAAAAALRAAGVKPGRIAQMLGVAVGTVRDYLVAAREWGGLDDVVRDIEFRHVPQAVQNLGKLLESGDKEATLETLKGRGVFRTFGNTKVDGPVGANAMQVNVTFNGVPAGESAHLDPLKQVVGSAGEIVGAPNR